MRHIVQIALTRTEAERRQYLQQFHSGHHDRTPGPMDSFIRWAYSDPRIDDIPLLLAEVERTDADYAGAMDHEADVLVRQRAEGKTPAQRVADYLALLGMENSDRVRMARVAARNGTMGRPPAPPPEEVPPPPETPKEVAPPPVVAPPPLVNRPPQRPAAGSAPLLTFRGGPSRGHTGLALVTFGWGPVILSRTAR